MDIATFKRSVASLSRNVQEGMGVFVCDTISDTSGSYPDISEFNTVLIKPKCGWVFATNAFNVSTDTGNVRLYCSSQISFSSPLPDALFNILRHFFPVDHTLTIFNTSHSFMYDHDGALHALCMLWSTYGRGRCHNWHSDLKSLTRTGIHYILDLDKVSARNWSGKGQ